MMLMDENRHFSIQESSFSIEESLKDLHFQLKNLHFRFKTHVASVADRGVARYAAAALAALLLHDGTIRVQKRGQFAEVVCRKEYRHFSMGFHHVSTEDHHFSVKKSSKIIVFY